MQFCLSWRKVGLVGGAEFATTPPQGAGFFFTLKLYTSAPADICVSFVKSSVRLKMP